jgi:Phosphotransferase enzyme family
MNSFDKTTRDSYRLIVTRRRASEILAVSRGRSWALPCLEIVRTKRIAEQLTTMVQEQWGLQTYCLLMPGPASSDRHKILARCAVMETVTDDGSAPHGTRWTALSALPYSDEQTFDQVDEIRQSMREFSEFQPQKELAPFVRPGWMTEVVRWSQEQIDSLGLKMTGGFRQLNASPTFSLIRFETTGPAVWFKATGEPNLHELPISAALARLFPKHVPAVIGTRTDWNSWLSLEVSGIELDELTNHSTWEQVAEALATLQVASIGKTAELLDAGCTDLRLGKITGRIDPFLARMAEFMASQEKRSPEPLTSSELSLLASRLKEACGLLERLEFPDALGHIDLNPGNILVSPQNCCFLDWSEGCVSHPFLTFEYLREYYRRAFPGEDAFTEGLTSAYVSAWRPFLPAHAITLAVAVCPLVAVFASAVSNDAWSSSAALDDRPLGAYLRSLTRRMHRESTRIAGRRERCVA